MTFLQRQGGNVERKQGGFEAKPRGKGRLGRYMKLTWQCRKCRGGNWTKTILSKDGVEGAKKSKGRRDGVSA